MHPVAEPPPSDPGHVPGLPCLAP
ncbi:hypothetical protein A2U01_0111156, partial [Trifolium medium]|nr:hypothetical protein [Trifolium medium]